MTAPISVPCPASGRVMENDPRPVISCPSCGRRYVTVELNEDGEPAIYPHDRRQP